MKSLLLTAFVLFSITAVSQKYSALDYDKWTYIDITDDFGDKVDVKYVYKTSAIKGSNLSDIYIIDYDNKIRVLAYREKGGHLIHENSALDKAVIKLKYPDGSTDEINGFYFFGQLEFNDAKNYSEILYAFKNTDSRNLKLLFT